MAAVRRDVAESICSICGPTLVRRRRISGDADSTIACLDCAGNDNFSSYRPRWRRSARTGMGGYTPSLSQLGPPISDIRRGRAFPRRPQSNGLIDVVRAQCLWNTKFMEGKNPVCGSETTSFSRALEEHAWHESAIGRGLDRLSRFRRPPHPPGWSLMPQRPFATQQSRLAHINHHLISYTRDRYLPPGDPGNNTGCATYRSLWKIEGFGLFVLDQESPKIELINFQEQDHSDYSESRHDDAKYYDVEQGPPMDFNAHGTNDYHQELKSDHHYYDEHDNTLGYFVTSPTTFSCGTCYTTLSSTNKLFKHLREMKHLSTTVTRTPKRTAHVFSNIA